MRSCRVRKNASRELGSSRLHFWLPLLFKLRQFCWSHIVSKVVLPHNNCGYSSRSGREALESDRLKTARSRVQRPCIISCSIAVSCTVQIMDQSWWAWNTSSQIRSDVVSTWACWKQNHGEMSNRWPWTCLLRGPCQFLSVFLAVFFIYKTLKESNNFICFSIREILNIRVYICICSSLLWELKNPCGCKVEVFWEGIEWFDKWCLINLLIN